MFIVKVPGVGEEKNKGSRDAGNAVLAFLKDMHNNEQGKLVDQRLLDLEEIHLDNNNQELSQSLIYKNALETFETKPKAVFLGGDHSITYSLARAFMDHCRDNSREPCLIAFDAHAGCEKGPLDKAWLRNLIEKGFPAEDILLVGLRSQTAEETEFLSKNRIRSIKMNQLLEDLTDICDSVMEFANGKELYLSLDIDVVDPAFAQGTNRPDSGGLSSRQMIYLVQRMNKMRNLKAAEIVEINPEKPGGETTARLGAKILAEMI